MHNKLSYQISVESIHHEVFEKFVDMKLVKARVISSESDNNVKSESPLKCMSFLLI